LRENLGLTILLVRAYLRGFFGPIRKGPRNFPGKVVPFGVIPFLPIKALGKG